jgi:hypothetical protein
MMRSGKAVSLMAAAVLAFALAGCCDSDKPLGIQENNVGVPPAIPLAGAAGFGVLAGTTVTNTGATSVTGDLGVSPGAAVTGFPPGTITGTQHAADATAATAQTDLTAAYNTAESGPGTTISVSGDLTGLTLAPGIYKSTSSLAISGDLTLTALGNPDAVFIIRMASTLTTATGSRIILAGGAKASNIIWQVGSSATLGTNSEFKGTIMALQDITVTTGASVDGRLLARNGAVTLDTNVIVTQ